MQYHYGQFTPDHLKKIGSGVELFNDQKYWECHEVLEDLWAEDTQDPARNVYWAIIQVAAACIHYRESNLIGAQGMIGKAKEKFRRCHELHVVTDLIYKYLDWQELEELVNSVPDGKKSELQNFKDIFDFRFKNYQQDKI